MITPEQVDKTTKLQLQFEIELTERHIDRCLERGYEVISLNQRQSQLFDEFLRKRYEQFWIVTNGSIGYFHFKPRQVG